MTERHANRRIDADELKRLGYPSAVINEAVVNAERGLFAIAPPEDVLRRTIEACSEHFPEPEIGNEADWEDMLWTYLTMAQKHPVALARVAAQPMLATIMAQMYSHLNLHASSAVPSSAETPSVYHKRPLILLDNHNTVSPARWRVDSELVDIRRCLNAVNNIAGEAKRERTVRLMLLKSRVEDYGMEEIEAVREILNNEKSDVFAVASPCAGDVAGEGRIIVGETVLNLATRTGTKEDMVLLTANQDGHFVREQLGHIFPKLLRHDEHPEGRIVRRIGTNEDVQKVLDEVIVATNSCSV